MGRVARGVLYTWARPIFIAVCCRPEPRKNARTEPLISSVAPAAFDSAVSFDSGAVADDIVGEPSIALAERSSRLRAPAWPR